MAKAFKASSVVVLFAVSIFLLLARLIPFSDIHDPWLDEATLLSNFPLETISRLFEPLPYFGLAAPLGYAALLNFLALFFPTDATFAFRMLSVFASLIGAGLIFATARRITNGSTLALALAFSCLTPFIVRYSLEIKPYIFEYLATALVMHSGAYLLTGSSVKRFYYFIGASTIAIIFSFTAPISIGAIGMGVIAHRWFHDTGEPRIKDMLRTLGALSLTAVIFFIYYYGYTRPVTAIQFSAHAYFYDDLYLTFPPLTEDAIKRWFLLPYLLVSQLDFFPQILYAKYQIIGLKWFVYFAVSGFFAAGVISAARTNLFIAASLISATLLIFSLSLVGLLPIKLVRHFTFMLPLTAIIMAFGVVACLRWSFEWAVPKFAPKLVPACVILVLMAIGIAGYHKANNLKLETLSPLISHIIKSDGFETPVWVYYSAQPAMRILAPKSLVQIGLEDHSSRVPGWASNVRNAANNATSEEYFERFAQTIRNRSKIWLVFSHLWLEPSLARFMEIAQREVGNCREVLTAEDSHLWRCGQN